MPRLPDVTDYGARPDLRSGRVDAPSQSGSIVAESLVNAQNTFLAVRAEKKAKKDRMNYALAKNAALQADIEAREALRDDEDWATYDERYTERFNSQRDEITARFLRDPEDMALFAAETDLVRARGRVAVADSARAVEIDEKATTLKGDLQRLGEAALVADPATANDNLLSALESLNAARDDFLSDEVWEKERREFVAKYAGDRLVGMDSKLRQEAIERSLASRAANGPIEPGDIEAGKGTGSVADFLPADVLTRMLNVTKKENEIKVEYEQATALVDEAANLYQEDSQALMAHIREQGKGLDAKTRARAVEMGRQLVTERRTGESERRTDIMISAGNLLREKDGSGRWAYSLETLPAEQLAELQPGQYAELERFYYMLRSGKQFADYTNWYDEAGGKKAYSTWSEMTLEEKLEEDLTNPAWVTQIARPEWQSMIDEQKRLRASEEASTETFDEGITNGQLVTATLLPAGIISSQTGDEGDEREAYYRTLNMLDIATQRRQEKEGRQLTNEERRQELAKVLAPTGYLDRDRTVIGGRYGWVADEKKPVALMSEDEIEKAFLPYGRAEKDTIPYGGQTLTIVEYLNKKADEFGLPKPDRKQIESAYFAMKNNIGGNEQATMDEIRRRLGD